MKVFSINLQTDMSYSNLAERALGEHISRIINWPLEEVTEGYRPDYDFRLKGKTFEAKFQFGRFKHDLKDISDHTFNIPVEVGKTERPGEKSFFHPAGFFLSQADYHAFVTYGHSTRYGNLGKLRIFRTDVLYLLVVEELARGRVVPFTTYDGTSRMIMFDPKKVDHLCWWLGDFGTIEPGYEGCKGYDLDDWYPNKSFSSTSIQELR